MNDPGNFEGDLAAALVFDTMLGRTGESPEEIHRRIVRFQEEEGDLWFDFFGPMMDRIEEALGLA